MRLPLLLLSLWVMGASSPGEDAKPKPAPSKTLPVQPLEKAMIKAEGAGKSESFITKINPLIGAIWAEEVKKSAAQLRTEKAEIRLLLDAKGKLISLHMISKNVTPAFATICKNAVRQAAKDFPPVPPELLDPKSKTFETPLTFHLY